MRDTSWWTLQNVEKIPLMLVGRDFDDVYDDSYCCGGGGGQQQYS